MIVLISVFNVIGSVIMLIVEKESSLKTLKILGMNNLNIEKEQDILEIREQFIGENYKEVYDKTVTLCHQHHLRLHSIYGKRPKLITAEKQERWVEKQRNKHGMV